MHLQPLSPLACTSKLLAWLWLLAMAPAVPHATVHAVIVTVSAISSLLPSTSSGPCFLMRTHPAPARRVVWDNAPDARTQAARRAWQAVPLAQKVSWTQTSTDVDVTLVLPAGGVSTAKAGCLPCGGAHATTPRHGLASRNGAGLSAGSSHRARMSRAWVAQQVRPPAAWPPR